MQNMKKLAVVWACLCAACGAYAQQVGVGLSPNVPSWVEMIAREGGRREISFGLKNAFGARPFSSDELRKMHINAFLASARKVCFADGKSGTEKIFNPVLFMRITHNRQRLQRAAESGRLFRDYAVAAARPEDLGGLSEKTAVFLEEFFRAERPERVHPQGAFLVKGNVVLRFAFEDGRPEKLVQITLNPTVPAAYICVDQCAFAQMDAKKLG